MDTRKFELDALSDDQLDAVSGGDQALEEAHEKKIASSVKAFQQAIQELP